MRKVFELAQRKAEKIRRKSERAGYKGLRTQARRQDQKEIKKGCETKMVTIEEMARISKETGMSYGELSLMTFDFKACQKAHEKAAEPKRKPVKINYFEPVPTGRTKITADGKENDIYECTCLWCGKTFETAGAKNFCCSKCYYNFREKRLEI